MSSTVGISLQHPEHFFLGSCRPFGLEGIFKKRLGDPTYRFTEPTFFFFSSGVWQHALLATVLSSIYLELRTIVCQNRNIDPRFLYSLLQVYRFLGIPDIPFPEDFP